MSFFQKEIDGLPVESNFVLKDPKQETRLFTKLYSIINTLAVQLMANLFVDLFQENVRGRIDLGNNGCVLLEVSWRSLTSFQVLVHRCKPRDGEGIRELWAVGSLIMIPPENEMVIAEQ